MNQTRQLYLMISETDTCLGRIIRAVSGYHYNHVSLTLDPTLRRWVSFGRFYQDAPLYAGFISEPVERYLARGYNVKVQIFRLEIAESRCRRLEDLFSMSGKPECGLIYNSFDIMAAALRIKMPIHGAYTCLSFACSVLDKHHISIRSLAEDLQEHLIYDGPLSALTPDSGSREDVYFTKYGSLHGLWSTVCQLAVLSRRAIGHRRADIVAQRLR